MGLPKLIEDFELPASPKFYPNGGTYADLLYWHLYIWGTRHDGTRKVWKPSDFRVAVFGINADSPTAIRRLNYWLGGGSPPDPPTANLVMHALFKEEAVFEEWRIDLRLAHKTSSGTDENGKKKNINTIADLWKAGLKAAPDQGHAGDAAKVQGQTPVGTWDGYAFAARENVAQLITGLTEHFYGRGADLAAIDAFVEQRMSGDGRGLMVITAPAGFGKSALAAQWCQRAIRIPDRHVARHFCSASYGTNTTSPKHIHAHLRQQISEVYRVPIDQVDDVDAITKLLSQAPPEQKQLILWLDGIDEAEIVLPCFLPQVLGERVCVMISARANEKNTPAYLMPWLEDPMARANQAVRRELLKLPEEDVGEMVVGMFQANDLIPPMGLGQRVHRASEQGYALFANNMILTAIEATKNDENIDLGDSPESLTGYAASELRRLRRLPQWPDCQPLFVFLTLARQAVRLDEFPALIGTRVFPDSIPSQISRWFSLVEEEGRRRPPLLSLSHPKLNEVFGQALGYEHDHALRDLCERHVDIPYNRWASYAWLHMPRHLLEGGYADEATDHLTDIGFVTARMKVLGTVIGANVMADDFMAWFGLTQQGHDGTPEAETRHLRFWNNYVAPVKNAAKQGAPEAWLQLMRDCDLTDSHDLETGTSLIRAQPSLLAQSLATLRGHEGSVTGAVVSLDDGAILSWGYDRALRLWTGVGAESAVLRGHNSRVRGALALPDGSGFLSWSGDCTLRLWDADGTERAVLRGHENEVVGALVLAKGRGFLSWSMDRTLRVWDAAGQQRKVLHGHELGVFDALELDDQGGFLSLSFDGTLRLWSAAGEERAVLRGYSVGVTGALVLTDNTGLLSWGDWTLHLWNFQGEARSIFCGHESAVKGAVALSDNGGFLSWSSDGTLRLWGLTGEERAVLRGHENEVTGAQALSNDSGFLSWSFDGTLRLWDAMGRESAVLRGHKSGVTNALVLREGRGFLSCGYDATLRLWNAAGDEQLVLNGHESRVTGALALPDGRRFLSWSDDTTLRLWETRGNESDLPRDYNFPVIGVSALANGDGYLSWSDDGSVLLSGAKGEKRTTLHGHAAQVNGARTLARGGFLSWSNDGTLRLWDSDGDERAVLRGHEGPVAGALALADGDEGFLSWSGDGTLRLWDVDGAERVILRSYGSAYGGALLLADGSGFLSWNGTKTLHLWDTAGEERAVLCGHRPGITGALALPNGGGFLSWGMDRTLRLWGPNGEERAVMSGHESNVTGAVVLDDGNGFLSWSDDNTLRLWDITGDQRAVLRGHDDRGLGALALTDGSGFISWGGDGSLRLWAATGEDCGPLCDHEARVTGALILPGNRGFLSWGKDGMLRKWDQSGILRNIWLSPAGAITQVELYGDEDHFLIVFGGHVGIVRVPFTG